ncbi:MAG: DUF805 domain-containing protein [Pseudomonadota bacterium]
MTFTNAVATCFRKYFTFSGRAARPEYWWFMLFVLIGNIAAGILDTVLFDTVVPPTDVAGTDSDLDARDTGPIGAVFGLATVIPTLSAGWRRMHDTGRSGLFLFYPTIVMIGIGIFVSLFGGVSGALFEGLFGAVMIAALIVFAISPFLVIWWLTRPSQSGHNDYGPHPSHPSHPEIFS